jgi:transposase
MTLSLRIDRGQRRRMKRLLQKTRSRIEALRARTLLLLHGGHEPSEVAVLAGCARATVYRTVAGALNARTGKVLHVAGVKKNSSLVIALLEALRRSYRRAKRIHLVLDDFIIHKSRQTLRHLAAKGARIRLHFLPPSSPESNVFERLWKQLHDHVTRDHTHRSIQPLMEAVDEFLAGAQPFPGTNGSMLAHAA